MMPGGQLRRDPAVRRLVKLFESLCAEDRRSLLDFAEFLAGRGGGPTETTPSSPLDIPRPDEESVVKAIRRLSSTYPMVDKGLVLNETSSLMAQHIMQGRPAREVIDELEVVFRTHYEKLREAGQ